MTMRALVAFLALCVLVAKAAPAAQPEGVETIVVTASKVPQPRGNVTQQIDVLTEDDIDRLVIGGRNIADALTYLPGIAVSVLSRNDANWGSYGGIGPKYTTWMLSGLPIDSFVDAQSLDLWAIERIEAQRGPASVLYPNYLSQDFAGNESPLAGTVNLILREEVTEALTRLAATYGYYDTVSARLYHQNRLGDLHFFGGLSYEGSDYTNYGTEDSWLNMIDDPEYDKKKIYLGTTYDFDEATGHRLSIFANQAYHDGDAGRPNRGFDHEYTLVNGTYNAPITDALTLQAKVGYRRYDRTWQEDNFANGGDLSAASDNGVMQNIGLGDVTLSLAHMEHSLLALGADFQVADYETYTHPVGESKALGNDAQSSQFGLFAQEEVVLGDLVLRAGGRFSRTADDISLLSGRRPGQDNQSWNEGLWSVGVRYNAPAGLSPFANVGTSFVPPGLKSVGGTLDPGDRGVPGKNGQLPNPDLDPEKGLGADVGVDYQSSAGLTLSVRGFLNEVGDAIVENVVSENPSQSQSVNAGKTTALGLELAVHHLINERVAWFANYTYTSSDVDNDVDPDQDGAEVPFAPEHMGNVGVDLTLPYDVRVSAYLHVAGAIYDSTSKANRRRFDAHELLNMKLRKLLVSRDSFRLDAHLDFYNLTNNEFEMPWQFEDPGFYTEGGLTARF